LTVDVGDGVKEMDWEEGTDRGYGTVFKFDRTKRGELKESNVVKFDWEMGAISALYLGGKWGR
jgi:hypothetical protein